MVTYPGGVVVDIAVRSLKHDKQYKVRSMVICPGGEIGRRKGLKIPRWQHRAGSIPALGTI